MKIGPLLADVWSKKLHFESRYPSEDGGGAFIGGGTFIGEFTVCGFVISNVLADGK